MFAETEKVELPVSRRTQRIFARVLLCVSGKTNDEKPFEEETFTIAVNADGGLLQLRKAVRKGQRLSLLQTESGQQEFCIVAHVEPIEGGFISVRVQFLEPHPEFWHVAFPPDDWTHHVTPIQNLTSGRPCVMLLPPSCVVLNNC
jgi:hypothetical protein